MSAFRTSTTLLTLMLGAAPAAAGSATELISAKPFGGKWLVILGSFSEPGQLPEKITTVEGQADVAKRLARFRSAELKGLMPCYEVVIAGAYDSKREARAVWKRLKSLGVDNYFKNGGEWVGRQRAIDSYCQRRNAPVANCDPARWVEVWHDRVFMKIPLDDALADRVIATAPAPKRLNEDVTVWIAPLPNQVLVNVRRADSYRLWGATRSAAVATCTVERFVVLTRGTPHFGWLQMQMEDGVEPKAPACGAPEVFAELSCPSKPGEVAYATPAGESLAVFALEAKAPVNADAIVEPLSAEEDFAAARAEARAAAKELKRELLEDATVTVFARAGRRIAVVHFLFMAGEGEGECGDDAYRDELYGVVEIAADSTLRVLSSVASTGLERGQLEGLVEINGLLYVLRSIFPNTRRLDPVTDGYTCDIAYSYCDCPC